MVKAYSALGSKTTEFTELESVPIGPHVSKLTFVSDEVTAVCPVTGQPDWYRVEINVGGPSFSIESKSLKLYLQSFRNEGLFCEALAQEILDKVQECVKAEWVTVEVIQKSRGGITLTAKAVVRKQPPFPVTYGEASLETR